MTRLNLWSSDKGDIPASLAFTNNLNATTDPGVSNDIAQGYEPGSQWINRTAGRSWLCLSATAGAAVWALDGASGPASGSQGTPGTLNATGTLTAALMLAGIVTSTTGAAVTATLDTAANLDTAVGASAPVNYSFDFSVINTGGTNAFTVATATGWTLVGNMAVALSSSGRFRARKTGAGAWTLYRM